ncbi:MAG TPA: enoyl-CoA hydratase [Desulfobacteraceae bacterium]|nr:enoyl-CoA hydratase [Desulfobacteraceae bacterium]
MELRHTRLEVEDRIAVLVIDSPPVNALGSELKQELSYHIDALKDREDVWTLILTASGNKIFLAGADIPALLDLDYRGGLERVKGTKELFSKFANFPKPIVVAINGTCLGAGLELSLCCDIRIAAEHATLGLPEVNLGIMPGAGGTQRLPRIINPGIARYLIYTGSVISAKEAVSFGIILKAVPYESLLDEAKKIAKDINRRGPLAVRAAKRAISQGLDLPIDEALDLENRIWAELCETQDKREGISAFLEKRRPRFQAR